MNAMHIKSVDNLTFLVSDGAQEIVPASDHYRRGWIVVSNTSDDTPVYLALGEDSVAQSGIVVTPGFSQQITGWNGSVSAVTDSDSAVVGVCVGYLDQVPDEVLESSSSSSSESSKSSQSSASSTSSNSSKSTTSQSSDSSESSESSSKSSDSSESSTSSTSSSKSSTSESTPSTPSSESTPSSDSSLAISSISPGE